MNKIEFTVRGVGLGPDDAPLIRAAVTDDKGNILSVSYIRWHLNRFCCYDSRNNMIGASPFTNTELVCKDTTLLKGQFALCVMDHLFILRDLRKISVEVPNLSGRIQHNVIDDFILGTKVYIERTIKAS